MPPYIDIPLVRSMSGAARCISRLAIRHSGRVTAKRKARCQDWRMPVNQIQSFSSVRCWLGAENNSSDRPVSGNNGIEDFDPEKTQLTINNLDAAARADYDSQPPEEQEVTRETLRILSDRTRVRRLEAEIDEEIAREVAAIDREAPISFTEKKKLNKNNVGFWADDEDDEFGQVPDGDDEFLGDDMTTPAHGQLDLHRDMREYQRRIAWDMPLLRSLSSPLNTPPPQHSRSKAPLLIPPPSNKSC